MDAQGSLFAFFFYQLLFTFLVLLYMHPVRTGTYSFTLYTVWMGVLAGALLGSLKVMIGYALRRGPASLTFASINLASIAPAAIFALFIDFPYTIWQLVGSIFVAVGLVWAVGGMQKGLWLLFAASAFLVHTLYLLLTQLYVIVVEKSSLLHSEWYVPIIFATACLMHMAIYWVRERRMPSLQETLWGIGGGLCNGACAYFFMQATFVADGLERGFIFPIFSISLILFCNIWGRWLYEEEVNWRATSLCLLGLFVGTQSP
jgi:drug/metabolite transporter (DMT)-like permease